MAALRDELAALRRRKELDDRVEEEKFMAQVSGRGLAWQQRAGGAGGSERGYCTQGRAREAQWK